MTYLDTILEKQLPVEQLNLLYKQSIPAFIATMAVLFYTAYKVFDLVNHEWLASWVGVIVLINIYLLYWIYRVHTTEIDYSVTRHLILLYQIEAILHGLAWGAMPFLFVNSTHSELHFFAYIVLCGMAAGAIGTTAMIMKIYLSFMLPMMLPAILVQLFYGDTLRLFNPAAVDYLIIFVLSMIVLAHTYYKSIQQSISLIAINKQLFDDATEAFKNAEAANHAKSAFLANMSHELRTPLNAVIGYSELIHDNAEDNEFSSVIEDADKITHAGQHLLSLINGVLDLSKIESGKMDVYIEDIYLQSVLEDIRITTEALIMKNNNVLRFDVPEDLPLIQSDITKLRQILLNILSNAAKFTRKGKVSLKASVEDNMVKLVIRDTGIGMTAEQLKKLTQPFVQAEAFTSKKYGGTGLGMSLTEHLAKLLNIQLEVSSEPGKGTTFVLLIPVQPDQKQKKAEAA